MSTYDDAKRNLLQIGVGGLPGSGPIPDEKYNDVSTAYDAHPGMPMVTGNVLDGPSKYVDPDAQMAAIGRNAANNAALLEKLQRNPNEEADPLTTIVGEAALGLENLLSPSKPTRKPPNEEAAKAHQALWDKVKVPTDGGTQAPRATQGLASQAPKAGGSGGGGVPDAFKAGFHLDEIPITKETQENMRLAGEAKKEALSREAMVQAGFELSKQKATDEYLTKADELEKKTNAILQVKAQAAEDANKTLQTYNDDIQNTKIDPNRLFSSTNALQLAMFGMASVLSTVGKGDPMVGFNAMERAIDRDIDAQKADLATKKSGFDRQSQLYAKMLDRFGDPIQATEASKIALRHQLAGQMESLGSQSQSQTILNNKDAAIAQFNEETANKRAQLEQMVHVSKQQQYAAQMRGRGAGGGAGVLSPKQQEDYKEGYIPELGIVVPKKEAAEVRLKVSGARKEQRLTQELKQMAQDTKVWTPSDKKNWEEKANDLAVAKGERKGQRQQTAEELAGNRPANPWILGGIGFDDVSKGLDSSASEAGKVVDQIMSDYMGEKVNPAQTQEGRTVLLPTGKITTPRRK